MSGIPIALIMKDGLTHESKLAIPLLRKARPCQVPNSLNKYSLFNKMNFCLNLTGDVLRLV